MSPYRRTLAVVMFSQVFSGAGLAAGVTVGSLLAAEMLGTTSLSGLPSVLFTFGSAGAALGVGRLSQRLGRRAGLTAGYVAGALGSAGVVLAAVLGSVSLLLPALLIYGAGSATNLQARYAGADLAEPRRRGSAVSSVLVATTFGAVAGPNLVAVTGRIASGWGIPALAGPFALAAVAYALAAVVIFALLRPDPLTSALAAASAPADEPPTGGPGVVAGVATMVLTQIVMVAVMTMTPVHMQAHGHGLSATGLVIAVHIAAMFLPSPLTGYLVDRVGRTPVATAAGVTLLAAGLVSATAPEGSVALLTVALALLGLGWNLGLVSGTAMITDAVPQRSRAKTQGAADLGIALSGAAAGLGSGVLMAATSYAALSIVGGLLALAVIPFVAAAGRRQPDPAATTGGRWSSRP
ncbi:MFS transporter [Actinoplanes awajinensis]|uniref:MFS transporter n=1 Tax=Actinoplanes awajinensis subsp. mycoplanecinus TaxID=135947 RepID=A0A0X3V8C1_9ACTN|nr:MFS transporter [Actinoplanes awajinensis]KUL41099.1 MFS transporter [Actinoplanes awajinensis subsp. mycoplanecinus]